MGKESNSTDSEKVVTIFSISLSKKVDISMYWREEDEEDEEVMTLSWAVVQQWFVVEWRFSEGVSRELDEDDEDDEVGEVDEDDEDDEVDEVDEVDEDDEDDDGVSLALLREELSPMMVKSNQEMQSRSQMPEGKKWRKSSLDKTRVIESSREKMWA